MLHYYSREYYRYGCRSVRLFTFIFIPFLGWGLTATWPGRIGTLILKEAPIPIIEPFRCSIDPRIQICAGGQGSSACVGDSGGPLFCEDHGKWVLQGVVSNGDMRCPPLMPSEFTRVGSYMDWIVGIVNGKKCCKSQ